LLARARATSSRVDEDVSGQCPGVTARWRDIAQFKRLSGVSREIGGRKQAVMGITDIVTKRSGANSAALV